MPKINSLNFIQSFWKIVACQISEFAENEPTPALFLGNNEWPPLCYEERRNYPNGVADFSKAFDTVCFKTTIDKFYKLGFSKMSNRLQFDEKASVFIITQFWILQGSILGLMIFNLYVVDLHEIIPK